MNSEDYKFIFAPDSGALLDIRILETTPQDWQILLDFLPLHYEISYAEDGNPTKLPSFELISERRKKVAVSLKFPLSIGITVSCYFFDSEQIEMDFLPEDVNTPEKAQIVFDFMIVLARLLKTRVFLVPESSSSNQTEFKERALCSADPQSGSIRYQVKR